MKPLIVALDVESDIEALRLVRKLKPQVDLFKVGPVLFLKYGGELLSQIRALGAEIFLDMKFHDIPSVVAKAIARAGEWGVYSATLHIAGGQDMIKESVAVKKRPRLWGVTVLTSLDAQDLIATGITRALPLQVTELAHLGKKAGLEGVISSAQNVKEIKRLCGKAFTVVTPGIRWENGSDDQKRTHTPVEAMKDGADFFVVGRPVTQSANPVATVQMIYRSLGK